MKFTPFVVLASCVAFVAAAPLDVKDATGAKLNRTDADAMAKSVMYSGYPIAGPTYGSYAPGSFSNQYSQYPASIYSYGYPSAAAALPHGYGSNSYYTMYDQTALPASAKTIGHLRGFQSPMPYIAQSQIYAQPQMYAVPVASSYSQFNHQPQYSYPAYSSYSYGRMAADEPEMTVRPQSSLQPAVNYHTKYILEQPEYVRDQPQIIELQSNPSPRTAIPELSNEFIATSMIPTGYKMLMRDVRDVAMDDKLQLHFNPQYLMNRYQAQMAGPIWKAAADEPLMSGYEGQLDPEDKVYVSFNQFQPEVNSPTPLPLATKDADPSLMYPAQMNWSTNQGGLPYSPENIFASMQNMYAAKYLQQVDELYKTMNQKPTTSTNQQRHANEFPGFSDKIKELREKSAGSDTSKTSANEPKKDMKDDKSTEKSS